MAKWGEGDPRWIVEERPDATNVNNWHWTEKNATPWSKDRIRTLFQDFIIRDGDAECKVTAIEKIDGEATANNRKGKLIFFYEWNILMKWAGAIAGQEKMTEGTIYIPNLSEENDLDEIEVTIVVNESNDEADRVKKFMYNTGRGIIRKQVGVYLKELREEFSKGLILPKKDDVNKNDTTTKMNTDNTVSNITSGFNKQITMDTKKPKTETTTTTTTKNNKVPNCKVSVATIKLSEKFNCRAQDLYDVFTREDMTSVFTQSSCKVNASKGGEFELFGGNIIGKFEELIPNEKIVQSWRYRQWPVGHYSNVVISFCQKDDHTDLKVTQSGVPEGEQDTTIKNWKGYYFTSIKQSFGFGSFLV